MILTRISPSPISTEYITLQTDWTKMSLPDERLACTVLLVGMCLTCIRSPMREAIAGGRGGRGGRADVNAPQSSPRGRGSFGEERQGGKKLEVNKNKGGMKEKHTQNTKGLC